MNYQASSVIIRPCVLVMTLAYNEEGEPRLLDDEEFSDFDEAMEHAEMLSKKHGVPLHHDCPGCENC